MTPSALCAACLAAGREPEVRTPPPAAAGDNRTHPISEATAALSSQAARGGVLRVDGARQLGQQYSPDWHGSAAVTANSGAARRPGA